MRIINNYIPIKNRKLHSHPGTGEWFQTDNGSAPPESVHPVCRSGRKVTKFFKNTHFSSKRIVMGIVPGCYHETVRCRRKRKGLDIDDEYGNWALYRDTKWDGTMCRPERQWNDRRLSVSRIQRRRNPFPRIRGDYQDSRRFLQCIRFPVQGNR